MGNSVRLPPSPPLNQCWLRMVRVIVFGARAAAPPLRREKKRTRLKHTGVASTGGILNIDCGGERGVERQVGHLEVWSTCRGVVGSNRRGKASKRGKARAWPLTARI